MTTNATPLRVGMIGLDTSHCPIFAEAINHAPQGDELRALRVTAAFPGGAQDFPLSRDRVGLVTDEVRKRGVEIVDSIDALLARVDCVLLHSVDGRQHLEQARPVFLSGKRVFIDKPLAASLADCVAIVRLGAETKAPWFTASSLRYMPAFQRLRAAPELGALVGCDAFSQSRAVPGHPDLFWYGMHGVEALYTLMGRGCRSVSCVQTPYTEACVGVWADGRVGTFRGIREHTGKTAFGVTAFGTQAILHESVQADYRPLLLEIARFFRTGAVPIDPLESLEIFAYLEAAEESKRRGGSRVSIDEVMARAGF